MSHIEDNFSGTARRFLGLLSSVFPFSVTEVLIAAAIILLICYIVKTIMITRRNPGKWKILGKRILPVAVIALYGWGLFCWLWNVGYHTPGFAENNGFRGHNVTQHNLAEVTRFFADKANELSRLVDRDDESRYVGNRRIVFAESKGVYRNAAALFPCLEGRLYRPKPMVFSWVMSRTGYTGMYMALTGEANINVKAPLFLMPVTVSHEHAHQLGVFAEDEASFVGILACVTSGNLVFEYAGYLSGLMHLMNALSVEDVETWLEIYNSLSEEILQDWRDNREFWQAQKKVVTGIKFLDDALTSVTRVVSDTVDTVYDGYLKSQDQELGIRSYGACVDLLVEYFTIN